MKEKIFFRKVIWCLMIIALLLNFLALIIALTNIIPDNPLKDYRLIIGISFITIGGFVRIRYKRIESNK